MIRHTPVSSPSCIDLTTSLHMEKLWTFRQKFFHREFDCGTDKFSLLFWTTPARQTVYFRRNLLFRAPCYPLLFMDGNRFGGKMTSKVFELYNSINHPSGRFEEAGDVTGCRSGLVEFPFQLQAATMMAFRPTWICKKFSFFLHKRSICMPFWRKSRLNHLRG